MPETRFKRYHRYRNTLWDMSVTSLRLKYAGSGLGIWWAIVTPLILAASINLIFTLVFKINMPNFTLFALSGIIPWMFFTSSLIESTNSFIVNSSILKQGIFPREFIPIAAVISNLLNFLIGLVFLLPLFVIFKLKVIVLLPALLMVIIIHLLFVLGIGLLFSSINVFFRDLTHFLSVGIMIWFWLTPIFYSLDMVPFPYRWICFLNPMAHYVILYREILFNCKSPSISSLSLAFLISAFFFVLGYVFFLKNEAALLKRI